MGLLPRLKSDKKLQAEGLDILTEMIRRELLNVSVAITDPSISLHCPVRDAIVRREATVRELLTGEPIKGGPGIGLTLTRPFRCQRRRSRQNLRDCLRRRCSKHRSTHRRRWCHHQCSLSMIGIPPVKLKQTKPYIGPR